MKWFLVFLLLVDSGAALYCHFTGNTDSALWYLGLAIFVGTALQYTKEPV